jgi:hypothetical protein
LVPFVRYYCGDERKEDEMGRACSMHVRKTINANTVLVRNLKEIDHIADLGIQERIL